MAKKKVVPQLKKKARHTIDPDSLAAALNWDRLADPGDMDIDKAVAASNTPVKVTVSQRLGYEHKDIDLGGPGSGNWAHVGRPGKRGGSAPRKDGMTVARGKDWLARYEKKAGKPHPYAEQLQRDRTERAKAAAEKKRTQHTAAVDIPMNMESYQLGVWLTENVPDNKNGMRVIQGDVLGLEIGPGNYLGYDDRWDDQTRGTVKDTLVNALSSRTGLPYDDVNKAIAQWANSSNDSDYRSLCLQEAAALELGTPLSQWQKDKLKKHKPPPDATSKEYSQRHVFEGRADPEGDARKLVREMYNLTQEEFKKRGITHVRLFRGVRKEDPGNDDPAFESAKGDDLNWTGNAMESWSSVFGTSTKFGGLVVVADIPVERIMGNCRTSFGCLNEQEFIVLAGDGNDAVTVIRNTYKN